MYMYVHAHIHVPFIITSLEYLPLILIHIEARIHGRRQASVVRGNDYYTYTCHNSIFSLSHMQGMSYEKTLGVRKKHISPGVITYYKNRVLIHQVGGYVCTGGMWNMIYQNNYYFPSNNLLF